MGIDSSNSTLSISNTSVHPLWKDKIEACVLLMKFRKKPIVIEALKKRTEDLIFSRKEFHRVDEENQKLRERVATLREALQSMESYACTACDHNMELIEKVLAADNKMEASPMKQDLNAFAEALKDKPLKNSSNI